LHIKIGPRSVPSRLVSAAAGRAFCLMLLVLLLPCSDIGLPAVVGYNVVDATNEPAILTDDERVRVEATSEIPWRAIVDLDIRFQGAIFDRGTCTGFFIGPRTVVTSAHCIYNHERNGYAAAVKVMPGRNSDFLPFGSQEVSLSSALNPFYVPQQWVDHGASSANDWRAQESDYGVITLPDDTLGSKVGPPWFDLLSVSEDALEGIVANVSGYPSDKSDPECDGTLIKRIPGCQLWTDGGRVIDVKPELDDENNDAKPNTIIVDAYMAEGQSGSPIWYYDGSSYNVVGIARSKNNRGAGGPWITEEVKRNILGIASPPQEDLLIQVKDFRTDRWRWWYNFAVRGLGRVLVKVDDATIMEAKGEEQSVVNASRVMLHGGCHQLEIQYERGQEPPAVGYGVWPDAANFDVKLPPCAEDSPKKPASPPEQVVRTFFDAVDRMEIDAAVETIAPVPGYRPVARAVLELYTAIIGGFNWDADFSRLQYEVISEDRRSARVLVWGTAVVRSTEDGSIISQVDDFAVEVPVSNFVVGWYIYVSPRDILPVLPDTMQQGQS